MVPSDEMRQEMAKTNKLTKAELVSALHEKLAGEATKAGIQAFLDALSDVVQANVKAGLLVEVPGVVKVKASDKPAQPAKQKKNPFTGQMMTVAAKPASKKVKVSPSKSLKDAIGG